MVYNEGYDKSATEAPVAQRTEHLTSNQITTGSSPVRGIR